MKCEKCFSELSNDAVFCQFCGAKQENQNNIEAQIDAVEDKLNITECGFSDKGRIDCREWIREFGFEEVCLAVNIALKQYLKFDKDGKPIQSSVNEIFSKISGICHNRKIAQEKPYLSDALKIYNYANKKFSLSSNQGHECKNNIERILQIYSKSDDYSDNFDELFWQLKKSDNKWVFLDLLNDIITEMERK